ncbi:hypothetical protein L873DRAFT_1786006 [Choiromyces venosus 120613-1]|uniref:Uncharacterized protein n=1 Tax=Choiromyces venosus 120613-1 TaxID=1336337 RepID=A0A3N4K2L2_9PEZI|nr:hypothetical protein L873DRAFT_1786006 [Choiromyces venosus 120613-1]
MRAQAPLSEIGLFALLALGVSAVPGHSSGNVNVNTNSNNNNNDNRNNNNFNNNDFNNNNGNGFPGQMMGQSINSRRPNNQPGARWSDNSGLRNVKPGRPVTCLRSIKQPPMRADCEMALQALNNAMMTCPNSGQVWYFSTWGTCTMGTLPMLGDCNQKTAEDVIEAIGDILNAGCNNVGGFAESAPGSFLYVKVWANCGQGCLGLPGDSLDVKPKPDAWVQPVSDRGWGMGGGMGGGMFGPVQNMNAGLLGGGNMGGGWGTDMGGGTSHGVNGASNIKNNERNNIVKAGTGNNNIKTGTGNNIIKTGAGNKDNNNIGGINDPRGDGGDILDNSGALGPEVTSTRKKSRTGAKVVKATGTDP